MVFFFQYTTVHDEGRAASTLCLQWPLGTCVSGHGPPAADGPEKYSKTEKTVIINAYIIHILQQYRFHAVRSSEWVRNTGIIIIAWYHFPQKMRFRGQILQTYFSGAFIVSNVANYELLRVFSLEL